MLRSLIAVTLLSAPAASFMFGGGCCAPQPTSCCGGATSWAYAPPRVIGYERIPLYAKVPIPPPPPPPQYSPMLRSPPMASPLKNPIRQQKRQKRPYPSPPVPPMYMDSPPMLPPPMSPMSPQPSPSFGPQSQQIIPLPAQGSGSGAYGPAMSYDEGGDTIIIETDDGRVRRVSKRMLSESKKLSHIQPPVGYAQSAPPVGYAQTQPQIGYGGNQEQMIGGQVETGVEVPLDQVNGNYGPQGGISSNYGPQGGISSNYGSQGGFSNYGNVNQGGISSNLGASAQGLGQSIGQAAFEGAGIAPSARRLRKFKN